MRIVIQRVASASVSVQENIVGHIESGLLVFLAIARHDTMQHADDLISKLIALRIFDDDRGKMNFSLLDSGASVLVVSQFTLVGVCDKGRRPSFDLAEEPQKAQQMYDYFINGLRQKNIHVETGQFRAMMKVSLVNDGPVTLILDSK